MEKRKLGYIESLCTHACMVGAGTTTTVTFAQIEGEIDEKLMVDALEVIFERHPFLHSVIRPEGEDYVIETSAHFENIPIAFVNHSKAKVEEVVQEELKQCIEQEKYLWRITLLIDHRKSKKKTHAIVFTCHHGISDGTSISLFIHDLLEVYEKLEENINYEEETLPFLDAVEVLCNNQKTIEEYQEEKKAIEQDHFDHFPFEKNAPLNERENHVYCFSFSEEDVEAIYKASKMHKVTINSTLNAAALMAMGEIFQKPMRFSTITPVDLRKYCIPKLGFDHFGFYIGLVQINCDVNTQKGDLFALAKDYEMQLEEEKKSQCFMPDRIDISSEKLFKQFSYFTDAKKESFPMGIGVTNLGKYPHKASLRRHKIASLHFAVSRTAGDIPFLIQVVTLEGVMHVCILWPYPMVSDQTAGEYCTRWIKQLEKACNFVHDKEHRAQKAS